MIRRYTFGIPYPTGSVVQELPVAGRDQLSDQEPFAYDAEGDALVYTMDADDLVYGLGESIRGMNKRGWLYEANNKDETEHDEEVHNLYASQNFLLIQGPEKSFGIYVDCAGVIRFDIGYTHYSEMVIQLMGNGAEVYLIDGEDPFAIVRQLRELTGRSYAPPRWALGFAQSRWAYNSAEEVRDIADRYERAGIPLDMIVLDLAYMDNLKIFTTSEKDFPNFPAFVAEMKARGIHLVPIIDAGVKIEEGYDIYEEGVKGNYFVKDKDGKDWVGAVWPGLTHFPDFLKPETRKWFGGLYRILMDQGIDGFWNDMNEPSIFYSEENIREIFEKIRKMGQSEEELALDNDEFWSIKGTLAGIAQNPEDYKRFYHDLDGKGEMVRHDKVHNIYGFKETQAAGEAFREMSDKRILIYSRSSYIGMHRYGGIWTGDNRSRWSHLLLNVQQMPALSMTGFLYSGADLGGFGADTTEDLMLRWMAFGIFTPLMRDHSALGTRRQELDVFGRTKELAEIVKLRYRLLPYIYSEFMKAVLRDGMYMAPMSFAWPGDDRARHCEDQLLLGEGLMLAPVVQQNVKGRMVYLPEEMMEIRFTDADHYETRVLPAGDHFVPVGLSEVVFFLRKGHVLPLTKAAGNTRDLCWDPDEYICFGAKKDSYELYQDDGESWV